MKGMAALLVILAVASLASADSDSDFAAQAAAAGGQAREQAGALKSKRREHYIGLGYLPKMVVVMEDQATDDWAKATPSKYDGLPILGPKTPNKRLREVWVRLQGTLNSLPKPPLAVAWDYYFPKAAQPESPATEEVARLFAEAPFPLILSGWTENGPLDERIHRDGTNRYQGHISVWNDEEKHYFSPTSALDHRIRDVPNEDTIVEATVAAVLVRKRRLAKEEAWREARLVAAQVASVMPAEDKGTSEEKKIPYDVKGIKLIERQIPEVSIQKVIERDPEALKKIDGAIVIVGNSITDLGDIFATGQERPKCYIHAWTIMQLLGSRMK